MGKLDVSLMNRNMNLTKWVITRRLPKKMYAKYRPILILFFHELAIYLHSSHD